MITSYFHLKGLSHCEQITDEGIKHIGTSNGAAEHLQVLELDNCPSITDVGLDHLVRCYNLRRVDIYDCQLISKRGIQRLRVRQNYVFVSFV